MATMRDQEVTVTLGRHAAFQGVDHGQRLLCWLGRHHVVDDDVSDECALTLLLWSLNEHDFTVDGVQAVDRFIERGKSGGEEHGSVCNGVTPILLT